MMKNLYSLFLLIFIFSLGTSVLGQEKTGKPLMKITVKDGKIVDAVPLDKSGNPDLASEIAPAGDLEQNHQTIIGTGVEQDGQINAPVREDTLNSPDRPVIQFNPQESKMKMGTLVVSPSDPSEPGAEPDESVIKNEIIPEDEEARPEKGQHLPVVSKPTSAVFDPKTANVVYMRDDSRDVKDNYVSKEADIRPEAGWEIIMTNDFEGAFPATNWNCYPVSGAADTWWDDNSYRASSGSWSLFCADMGTDAVTPPANYPNYMDSWAVYGPFDLSDATDADLNFDLWLDAESGWDHFRYMVSVDGTNYYGYSETGQTSGWEYYFFDLESVPTLGNITGNSSVYFALVFDSDVINVGTYEGAFVDDLTIWKYAQDVDLVASSLSLSTFNWYSGLTISADLTESNLGTDPAQAHYSRLYLSTNTTITTADIQLGSDLYFSVMAAGGTQTVTETFTAPTVADGTYYVGILVDFYNYCHETGEGNTYYLSTPVTYLAPADIDLSWSYLSVTTDTWVGGLTVTGTLTETNSGADAAGAHYSRLYLSTNSTISTADTQLGSDLYFGSVSAGGTAVVSETFTAPAWSSGVYYMGAIVDIYDDVVETDESNNALARSGPIYYNPDIDLYSTSIPLSTDTWVVGSPVTAGLTVVNGGADASGAHYSRLYLSDNNTISTGDVQLGGDLTFASIAGGGSQTVSGHTFNAPDVADGTYYVGNIVDIYDDVAETDEANNYATRAGLITSTHPAEVDLYWTAMSLTSTNWAQGDVVTAGLTVVNDEAAAAGAHYSRIYMSTNTTISTSDVQLGSDLYYSSVPAGGSVTENLTFTVPAAAAGIYYLGAMIDFYNDVVENDEANNTNYRTGTITMSDVTYTISATVNPAASGTVSGAGSYVLNATATLVATPATGYEFVNWTESDVEVSTSPSYSFTVTADRSLVANFQPIMLTVSTVANPVEGGTASGGGSYPYGSSVSLSAVPAAGFEFVNWTVLDVEVSTSPDYIFTVTENTVATANFTIATLTVTTVADPVDGGAVTGGGDYLYGETAVLAAVPTAPNEFRYWADQSDVLVSEDNPYSFTVVADITLKAIFRDPTGIGEQKVQDFELYPNPVTENLYVRVNVELSESAVASLYDVSGKVITNYEGSLLNKDVLELKTSHLNSGIYFLKITDKDTDTLFTGKVIKE